MCFCKLNKCIRSYKQRRQFIYIGMIIQLCMCHFEISTMDSNLASQCNLEQLIVVSSDRMIIFIDSSTFFFAGKTGLY